MQMRRAVPEDLAALAELYATTVLQLAPEHYTSEQVESWAAFATDDGFEGFVLDAHTLVVEDETGVLGYSGLEANGRIASLYVRPDRGREGIASRLVEAVLEYARERGFSEVCTDASELSVGVFRRYGFEVVEIETVERRGVVFECYQMMRTL
jgi:putative acetyltransferase